MDSDKNLILVTYVSGAFGSALVNLLCGSPQCQGQFKMSNGDHWHRQQWLFDTKKYAGGFIDDLTKIEIPEIVFNTDKYVVGQFHLMNADILKKHFPSAKIIMLKIDELSFNLALHRWWKVIGIKQLQLYQGRIQQISGAYDVIRFNREYYNRLPMQTENSTNILTIDFDQTTNCLDQIQKFLGITLPQDNINEYREFLKTNLAMFHHMDDNFLFAKQVIDSLGIDAPIIDLANKFESTQEFLEHLDEQK